MRPHQVAFTPNVDNVAMVKETIKADDPPPTNLSNNVNPASLRSVEWKLCPGLGGRLQME